MLVPGDPKLTGDAVRSIGLMLSKFSVQGVPMAGFAPGPFRLLVTRIAAFAEEGQ